MTDGEYAEALSAGRLYRQALDELRDQRRVIRERIAELEALGAVGFAARRQDEKTRKGATS